MRKDGSNIIGAGEDFLYNIFCELYGVSNVKRQYPLSKLVKDIILSSKQIKHKVDFLLYVNKIPVVVRVQDSHHNTRINILKDENQKLDLLRNGYKVVDIWLFEHPEILLEKYEKNTVQKIDRIIRASISHTA